MPVNHKSGGAKHPHRHFLVITVICMTARRKKIKKWRSETTIIDFHHVFRLKINIILLIRRNKKKINEIIASMNTYNSSNNHTKIVCYYITIAFNYVIIIFEFVSHYFINLRCYMRAKTILSNIKYGKLGFWRCCCFIIIY